MHSIRPDRLLLKKDNIIHCSSWSLKFGGNDVERNENKRWQRLPCLHYYIRLYTIIGIHTNNTMKYGELINKSDTYTHQNKSMFKIFVHNISYTKAQWHKKKEQKFFTHHRNVLFQSNGEMLWRHWYKTKRCLTGRS